MQRWHADGQKVHEKMYNTANHQGNANQDHNEILSHTYQNGYHQKTTNAGNDVKKREYYW